jgi:hypothetical protein
MLVFLLLLLLLLLMMMMMMMMLFLRNLLLGYIFSTPNDTTIWSRFARFLVNRANVLLLLLLLLSFKLMW